MNETQNGKHKFTQQDIQHLTQEPSKTKLGYVAPPNTHWEEPANNMRQRPQMPRLQNLFDRVGVDFEDYETDMANEVFFLYQQIYTEDVSTQENRTKIWTMIKESIWINLFCGRRFAEPNEISEYIDTVHMAFVDPENHFIP